MIIWSATSDTYLRSTYVKSYQPLDFLPSPCVHHECPLRHLPPSSRLLLLFDDGICIRTRLRECTCECTVLLCRCCKRWTVFCSRFQSLIYTNNIHPILCCYNIYNIYFPVPRSFTMPVLSLLLVVVLHP